MYYLRFTASIFRIYSLHEDYSFYFVKCFFLRTIVALSHLVMSCNHQLYTKLIDYLLDGLSRDTSASTTRTYIQCIAAIW